MSKNAHIAVNKIFELMRRGKIRDGVDLLYNYHYNKMYGIAFSIIKKEDISQDVVHNVVYRLMLLEPTKFPVSNELTWLYTVIKNESLMFLRNNQPNISLDNIAVEPIVENKDIHDFVDMDTYYSMIKGLNDEQRQVVTLKVLGGYTHKEISKMLGKPIGTIQWLYNVSIKKLKITLTSIVVAIFLSGAGFVERLVHYISQKNAVPELPGQTIRVPFDYSIVVFAVLFVFLSVTFLFILKKSRKKPTKINRKSI